MKKETNLILKKTKMFLEKLFDKIENFTEDWLDYCTKHHVAGMFITMMYIIGCLEIVKFNNRRRSK